MKLRPDAVLPTVLHAVVLLGAVVFLGGCHGGKHPASPLTVADQRVLDRYEEIRAALAKDDAKAAKQAAAKLVADLTPADPKASAPPLLEAATGVADATALDTMRQRFEKLSVLVVPMVSGMDGYYVMTSDLPNTVPWVQKTKDVDNPFFGRSMHWIGELKK